MEQTRPKPRQLSELQRAFNFFQANAHLCKLTVWERNFIDENRVVYRQRGKLSEKQKQLIFKILSREKPRVRKHEKARQKNN